MDNNYNSTTNKFFLWKLNSFFRNSLQHVTNDLISTISFAKFIDSISATDTKNVGPDAN